MNYFIKEHIFSIITIILICLVIFQPQMFSNAGIVFAIAWAYGLLFARLARIFIQYILLNWGVNWPGVLSLSLLVVCVGLSILYYAYTESAYAYFSFGWIVTYVGFDALVHSYRKQVGSIGYQLMTSLEYLVVALMGLALFGGYIVSTPLGQLGLEHQGLRGESLLFVALIIFSAEILHDLWYTLKSYLQKLI